MHINEKRYDLRCSTMEVKGLMLNYDNAVEWLPSSYE